MILVVGTGFVLKSKIRTGIHIAFFQCCDPSFPPRANNSVCNWLVNDFFNLKLVKASALQSWCVLYNLVDDVSPNHAQLCSDISQHLEKLGLIQEPCKKVASSSEVQNKMIFMGHEISSCHVLVVRSFFIYFKIISSSWNCWYNHLPKYFNITLKLPNMTLDKSKRCLVLTKYHILLSQQGNFSCPKNNIFKLIPWSCKRWKKT